VSVFGAHAFELPGQSAPLAHRQRREDEVAAQAPPPSLRSEQHGLSLGHSAEFTQLVAQLRFPAPSSMHVAPASQHAVGHGVQAGVPPVPFAPPVLVEPPGAEAPPVDGVPPFDAPPVAAAAPPVPPCAPPTPPADAPAVALPPVLPSAPPVLSPEPQAASMPTTGTSFESSQRIRLVIRNPPGLHDGAAPLALMLPTRPMVNP
jgi:hypothetical protein